jgi:nitronate monooxygenase
MATLPKIIQGGMGVGVSNWSLAQAVSRLGQLGVVSGTALDQVLVRRLADGDIGGAMRRGLDAFPFPQIARRIYREFFIPGGKQPDAPYPNTPMHRFGEPRKLIELSMVANFVEVFLARQGHSNPVGINYLEKVQTVHLPSIYGAMLAGVSYVLMGAGIPLHIPGVLDAFAAHQPAEYKLTVTPPPANPQTPEQTPESGYWMRFDPADYAPADYADGPLPPLVRPNFLAIVSSNTLAATMFKRANGRVDGLVIETRTAGGHNAPPRGKLQLSPSGEPIYGPRDQVAIKELRALGVPFWLAGGYGSPEMLREALDQGAAGIQAGTIFEFAQESGLREDYKRALLAQARNGQAQVFTDPQASPTGFPFKVATLPGTASDTDIANARPRVCNLGFLREPYISPQGHIAYRCAAEPVESYLAKGGRLQDTVGRQCLCNALLANIGHAQIYPNSQLQEPALITAGDDLNSIARILPPGQATYTAADVLHYLQGTGTDPGTES